ncbi:aminoglycoside phosphotransferase family protein [Streptomyces sp. NPDC097619]|uniref:aminoglycoside phosphotransferase family protein n=1 Tax=Streptomyces sp. NPDC097619 TaxID=3157228 RepID=UPI00332BDE7C
MHADEPDLDPDLVARLVAGQFPRWGDLPVAEVATAGTSNAMYRLGEELVVRLPRTPGAAADSGTEHTWLPRLAPALPLPVPVPLERGRPAEGYPWNWSVFRWLPGERAAPGLPDLTPDDARRFAVDLGAFLTALHAADPTDGFPAYRSESLVDRDEVTRAALAAVGDAVDTAAAVAEWEAALAAPGPEDAPVWIHADLQPGNVLLRQGRLGAVIDFGCFGLGDPAVDLIAAWYLLPAHARDTFRTAVGADPDAWRRGRGWALSVALRELEYYRDVDPVMTATARHVLAELLPAG